MTTYDVKMWHESRCHVWWMGMKQYEKLRYLLSYKLFKKKMYKLHGWEI